jgi:hypothetical protein
LAAAAAELLEELLEELDELLVAEPPVAVALPP